MISSKQMYLDYIEQCLEKYPEIDDAMRYAVSSDGRDLKERGEEELRFLLREGLKEHDYIIDFGCGAGALLIAGIENHCGPYLGLDIHRELIKYAEQQLRKGNTCSSIMTLADACGGADWIVFFSVFSHMLDREIYRMLQDAFRVLKPGGRCVFTYRDWSDRSQWTVFMNMVKADDDETKIPLYDNLLRAQTVHYWLRQIGFGKSIFYHPNVQVPKCVLGQTTVVVEKPQE